jgi:FSR family fosmidomycin resistance protein-like MFS transporter
VNPRSEGARPALWFLLILSLTHGVVDLSAGAILALLPTLRQEYLLSYTMVGMIPLFSNLTSTFTQPIFGYLSDRAEKRWLLPLSLALGGIGLAAVGYLPSYWLVLAAVVFSALGTSAFHPEGAHAAHNLSGGRRALAMAIYNVGGNIGYALGPIYASTLIGVAGLKGTGFAAILPLALAGFIVWLLPRWQAHEQSSPAKHVRNEELPPTNWLGTGLLTLLVVIRSVINLGVASYVPFFWTDVLQNDPASAGLVQMTYLIAGVGGTLLGAPLADRFGTKKVLAGSFALLLPLQIALPYLRGPAMLICLFLSGFMVVSTFTITLVMTQEYMPRSLGLASGLNLGLAFGMGGVGTMLLGMVADRWGVVAVLHVVAALVVPVLLLSLVLPPVQRESRPLEAAPGQGVAK